MSPRSSDGPHSPHTVYTTSDCWEALETGFLMQRLQARQNGTDPLGKIDFTEQVLWEGLRSMGLLEADQAPAQSKRPPRGRRPTRPEPARREPQPPVESPPAPTDPTTTSPEPTVTSQDPPAPPASPEQPKRRRNPADRFKQQSAPGRPVSLASAAGGANVPPRNARIDRPNYDETQLRDWLGLEPGQFEEARRRGLIPPPDLGDGRWSAVVASELDTKLAGIVAQVSGGKVVSG